MIAKSVIYLFFIGILPLISRKPRYDRVVALIITCLSAAVFWFFNQGVANNDFDSVHLIWDSSRSGDIKIDIISSFQNYQLVFPFFLITLMALFNNVFFAYEQQKKIFASALVLNLVCIIMLIASNNFVQVITFVFAVDIISQFFIKDICASRRYSIYNLVADMGLYLVLAMVHGILDNLDVSNIDRYTELGRHRDYIAVIILISLFIKSGFFLFQNYLLDLKSAKFHRLIVIPYLSSPMVSLILFMKMSPLLVVSPTFLPLLNSVLLLTALWGTIGALIINDLKAKTLYLNMMVLAFIMKLVESNNFLWHMHLSWLLVLGFSFNCCLYYLHYYANRKNKAEFICRFQKCSLLPLKIILIASILVIMAFSMQTAALTSLNNPYWISGFAVLFTFVSAHIFRQALSFGDAKIRMPFTDYRPLPLVFVIIAVSCWLMVRQKEYWAQGTAVAVLFFAWMAMYPLRRFAHDNRLNLALQRVDIFSSFYGHYIARWLKFPGRVLTVFVDFVLIEKTFAVSFAAFNRLVIRGFRKFNRSGILYYSICMIFGVLIIFGCLIEDYL